MKKPNDSCKRKKATSKPYRCAIYARCATDVPKSDSNSIAKQIRICTEYAEQRRWPILKEFVGTDVAVSGTSLAGRDALKSLMEAAEKQPQAFERVLIADRSRLARQIADDLLILKYFGKNGVEVVAISEGSPLAEIETRGMPREQIDDQYLVGLREKFRSLLYCSKCQGRNK
jgi:DNA invertase Pin-like site-specific DNA recombinase